MGLVALSSWYFVFYAITGVALKYFTNDKIPGLPHMSQMGFTYNSTAGGVLTACAVVAMLGWVALFRSKGKVSVLGKRFPREYLWILPSGVCTGVIIPTTTLMYTFGSIMVAMILMRGSLIIVGRVVDAIQIWQGICAKKVHWEENAAVVIAILAVLSVLLGMKKGDESALFHSLPAMVVFGCYIVSYMARLYIMNHYRHTRQEKGKKQDNRPFFAIEQAAAAITTIAGVAFVVLFHRYFNWTDKRILDTVQAAYAPTLGAVLAGIPFGAVAFFSVFMFMYEGKSATFNTLANRLVSLMAGTATTLVFALPLFGGNLPTREDWDSLVIILCAMALLVKGDLRRKAEEKK